MKYDVVIIGCGPAGSITARYAAEKGAKVLIVERRNEVGVPVLCGEGISKKVDEFKVLEGKRWVANEMNGARIFSPNGTMVKLATHMAGSETGYVLYRDIFDQELARGAVRAGADLLLNTRAIGLVRDKRKIKGVRVRQFGEEFDIECNYVVGADGVESKVGKWAGINTTLKPRDLEICAQYTLAGVECDKDFCDFYLGRKVAPGGYAWVFPKSEDIANVGIGILASFGEPGKALELLNRFIDSHPEIKKGKPIRFLAGAVPVSKPIQAVKNNVMLVGDAARQADPITGGGLMASIEAGMIAGRTIGKAVEEQREEVLLEYTKTLEKSLYKKLRRNYRVKEILLGFEDKTLNKLADSLKDYKFEEFSTLSIIKALISKHPSLLLGI